MSVIAFHARKSAPAKSGHVDLALHEWPSDDDDDSSTEDTPRQGSASTSKPRHSLPTSRQSKAGSTKTIRVTRAAQNRKRALKANRDGASPRPRQRQLREPPRKLPGSAEVTNSPINKKRAAELGQISPLKRQRRKKPASEATGEGVEQRETPQHADEQVMTKASRSDVVATKEPGAAGREQGVKPASRNRSITRTTDQVSMVQPITVEQANTVNENFTAPAPVRPHKGDPGKLKKTEKLNLRVSASGTETVPKPTAIRLSELNLSTHADEAKERGEDSETRKKHAHLEKKGNVDSRPAPDKSQLVLKPTNFRSSGLNPSGDADAGNNLDVGSGRLDVNTQMKLGETRPGCELSEAVPAATARRQKQSQGNQDDRTERSSLQGKWTRFLKVKSACKSIGETRVKGARLSPPKVKLRDQVVKAIVVQVDECVSELTGERGPDQEPADWEIVSRKLSHLRTALGALCYTVGQHVPEFKNQIRCRDIYFHLFAKLVKLIHALTLYLNPKGGFDMPIQDLEKIISVMQMVKELQIGVKHYVPPEQTVIRSVRDCICSPLAKLHQELSQHVQFEAAREKRRRQVEANERREKVERHREAEEERERSRIEVIRKRWADLQHERKVAEGLWMSRDKAKHLGDLGLRNHGEAFEVELDAEGQPMERVGYLAPRFGPPPARIMAARAIYWTDDELEALVSGLQACHGEHVLTWIIRRCCKGSIPGPVGILNRFNVIELVTKTADLKQYLLTRQQLEEGEVQDWVKDIPEWPGVPGVPRGRENTWDEVD